MRFTRSTLRKYSRGIRSKFANLLSPSKTWVKPVLEARRKIDSNLFDVGVNQEIRRIVQPHLPPGRVIFGGGAKKARATSREPTP